MEDVCQDLLGEAGDHTGRPAGDSAGCGGSEFA